VITVVTGTCGSDDNLEVDGAGNLYFSCYTSQGGAIYKVDAVSHALTQLVPGGWAIALWPWHRMQQATSMRRLQ